MTVFRGVPLHAASVLAGVMALACTDADPSQPVLPMYLSVASSHVTPSFTAGSPSCVGLGYDFGFRPQPEPPTSGTYWFPDGANAVTITSDGRVFDWTSTLSVDAVIVKGGPNANVYVYDPPAEESSDDGLHSPINSSTSLPYLISHLEFCYDYELAVTKTADAEFTRTHAWSIQKTAGQTDLTLSPGQSFAVTYDVHVDASATDSDWGASGTIAIDNYSPYSATITGVADVISPSIVALVDCGVAFPHVLAAGGTLNCSYSAVLPDGATRTNTATVSTSGQVGGGQGEATVVFGAPTREIDACVDVTDTQTGPLGTICRGDAPAVFTYSSFVGPYSDPGDCGTQTVVNTAGYTTDDTGTTGSSTWTVSVDVVCVGTGGCTLSPGYWKTHSELGPAPYDDAWALLPNGASTPFFLSGDTYHGVLRTPPGGDPYRILAQAYVASALNLLNGADPTDAQAAFDAATTLFSTALPGRVSRRDRGNWISLAGTLAAYNNGLIGPGRCDEDSSGNAS